MPNTPRQGEDTLEMNAPALPGRQQLPDVLEEEDALLVQRYFERMEDWEEAAAAHPEWAAAIEALPETERLRGCVVMFQMMVLDVLAEAEALEEEMSFLVVS